MSNFSELLDRPVLDRGGARVGVLCDLGVDPGEVFPHITSLALRRAGEAPIAVSWDASVARLDAEGVHLALAAEEVGPRPDAGPSDEIWLARDILNKRIVDTQQVKVARASDLKLSCSGGVHLRLLGAEIGVSGLLRAISPGIERAARRVGRAIGRPLADEIVAWSYMDLLERTTEQIRRSVSHKTINELHPADIADILEQLEPAQRTEVFSHLATAQAAETVAEIDDEALLADALAKLSDADLASLLAHMDPDDAAAFIAGVDHDQAEALLSLMDEGDARAIRRLLSYRESTAGRIMTSEFVALPGTDRVADAVAAVCGLDEDFESVHYVYTVDADGALAGVLSLRTLIGADPSDRLQELAFHDVVCVAADLDQEGVADEMTKYHLVAVPVCDEDRRILGIVTVDDALSVIAAEHDEDLRVAGVSRGDNATGESAHMLAWFSQRHCWLAVWALASCVIAAALNASGRAAGLAIYPMCAMPVALLAARSTVSFAKGFFLECDACDGGKGPYGGFLLRTSVLGAVFAASVYLGARLVAGVAFPGAQQLQRDIFTWCFAIAAAVSLGSSVSAVAYLRLLFWRDGRGLDTSGTALGMGATLIAAAAFSLASTIAILSVV